MSNIINTMDALDAVCIHSNCLDLIELYLISIQYENNILKFQSEAI